MNIILAFKRQFNGFVLDINGIGRLGLKGMNIMQGAKNVKCTYHIPKIYHYEKSSINLHFE